jgi:hypothetical protein
MKHRILKVSNQSQTSFLGVGIASTGSTVDRGVYARRAWTSVSVSSADDAR